MMQNKSAMGPDLRIAIVLIIYWILCSLTYPYLPDMIPNHWDIYGQVNGYGSKATTALVMPLLPIGVYLMMSYLPKFDPRRENYLKFSTVYKTVSLVIVFFLAITTLLPILVGLGLPINVTPVISGMIGLLTTILGNFMGKIRHNYFLGIRTPWTLADEHVWNRTHRLGGRMMVVGGTLSLLSILVVPHLALPIVITGTVIPVLAAAIYSYVEYKKKH
jgi:uncharacterized membrane protein